jgi:hypothetical protein
MTLCMKQGSLLALGLNFPLSQVAHSPPDRWKPAAQTSQPVLASPSASKFLLLQVTASQVNGLVENPELLQAVQIPPYTDGHPASQPLVTSSSRLK